MWQESYMYIESCNTFYSFFSLNIFFYFLRKFKYIYGSVLVIYLYISEMQKVRIFQILLLLFFFIKKCLN